MYVDEPILVRGRLQLDLSAINYGKFRDLCVHVLEFFRIELCNQNMTSITVVVAESLGVGANRDKLQC